MPLEKFLVETVSLALQNPIMAALLVILYLQWTVRFGAAAQYFSTLEGLVAVVIALSHQVENVDEEAVSERFNGGDSSDFISKDDLDELTTDYPRRDRGGSDD